MNHRGIGRGGGGPKKRLAVSYTIRDVEEPLNRAGVNALAIDPAQRLLYTAGRDAIIRCWDISPARGRKQCSYVKSLEHHTDWINDITLCGDGRYMMSASSDTTLKVWDTTKGSCSSTLRTHKDYVRCLAYAKEKEVVASAGLDRIIYLWDIKTLTSLTAAKNTVTTTTLVGHKESIYSIAMNDSGTVLVSGSTEKFLRVWDPRTNCKVMKLKGHTDNVRKVVLNREGSLCLSGSSDGTVRLWSLGQQRCVETFRVHDEGVWALTADDEFEVFYSGGRDRQVCATELTEGGQEGVVLFCEDSPILNLQLDPTDNCLSIWAATTSTHVNKWPVDPGSITNGEEEEGGMDVDEEEDGEITDIDDPQPLFTHHLASIPGGRSIRDFRVLSNRQQVLTKDSKGDVALWDVLHAIKEEELGKVDIDEEADSRRGKLYIPNWFSVEVKTGMLTIRLEETDCFSAWVMSNDSRLNTVVPELKLNLGALTLHALFENWPSAHTALVEGETRTVEKGSSPAPPPQLEDLMEMCGGDAVKDWEGIGKAICIPESKLEDISLTHKEDVEKCKEQLFKVWLKESEDVRWERMIEALLAIGLDELAKAIKEKFCSPPETEEVPKPAGDESLKEKVCRYFRVPEHTPVVLSEVGDCGTTLMRFLCGEAGGSHENRQLNNFCPTWIIDIVCQDKLPDTSKINFSLGKYEPGKKEGKISVADRLSAQDILTIRKVHDYAYNKVYGEEGRMGEDGEKLEADTCLEILCMDQVLDKELDLRTVKYSIWKSSGDMRLYYREVDPLPKAAASEKDKKTADKADLAKAESNESNSSNGQKMAEGSRSMEEGSRAMEEGSQSMEEKEEMSSKADEQEGEGEVDTEERTSDVPVYQDPDKETNREERGSEKMEDSRTEEETSDIL